MLNYSDSNPMPNQYKVPQNVLIEDRILPFMTLKQLIICFCGGTVAYGFYLALQKQPSEIWMTAVILIGILTFALAFVRINDIAFPQYALFVLERYLIEKKRVWMQLADTVFVAPEALVREGPMVTQEAEKVRTLGDLEQLTRMVDKGELQRERWQHAASAAAAAVAPTTPAAPPSPTQN